MVVHVYICTYVQTCVCIKQESVSSNEWYSGTGQSHHLLTFVSSGSSSVSADHGPPGQNIILFYWSLSYVRMFHCSRNSPICVMHVYVRVCVCVSHIISSWVEQQRLNPFLQATRNEIHESHKVTTIGTR